MRDEFEVLGISRAEVGRDQKPGGLSPVGVLDKKGRAGSPGIPCRSAGCEPGWVEGDIVTDSTEFRGSLFTAAGGCCGVVYSFVPVAASRLA